jgi:hypothetical protein
LPPCRLAALPPCPPSPPPHIIGNGTIDKKEFCHFIENDIRIDTRSSQRQLFSDRVSLGERHNTCITDQRTMAHSSQKQRRDRIAHKTLVADLLRQVHTHIKHHWQGCNIRAKAERIFRDIDVSEDGRVSKTEFYEALGVLDFKQFNPETIGLLWTTLDVDYDGCVARCLRVLVLV